MDLDPRKPFAENIASGLQGLSLLTTAFLYFFAAIVLVPLSILTIRVSRQKASPYLIPLLVLLFIVAEYLYCWRLLFKVGPARPLPGVGILAAIIYACYRVPADFMDRSWSHFEVLRRSLSWLFGGTVVRSIVAPLVLLVGYCALYYGFRIRGRRFIVVSDFHVWGKLAEKFPKEGVAARLQDELMRLCAEMKAPDTRQLAMQAGSVASSTESDGVEARRGPSLFYSGGFSLPETQVTLQYEGISFEGLHTFVRRRTAREVVISGDLITHSRGLLLAARTLDDGPWEVRVNASNSVALGLGLQRLALRIMTTLTQKFEPKAANAFVVLQIIAGELQEYDQAFDLARLGWQAAPDPDIANRNLASALNDLGIDLADNKKKYDEAIIKFKEAAILDPSFEEAHENLGRAYMFVGNQTEADEAFGKANEIKAGAE